MPNPNPKTEQLAKGRGRRPKLEHVTVAMRMSELTKQVLEQIALDYGCLFGGKPQIAGLLAKIASGELIIVPAPPSLSVISPSARSKTIREPDRIRVDEKYKLRADIEDLKCNTQHSNASIPNC